MKAAKIKSPPREVETKPAALLPVEALAPVIAADAPPPCQPTEDEIRVLAYHKWVAAGCPPGDGVCFWLEAEKELWQNRRLGHASAEHEPCGSA